MYLTIEAMLRSKFPALMAEWDCWDYKLWGPLSFDDNAVVTVWLLWESGRKEEVTLVLI